MNENTALVTANQDPVLLAPVGTVDDFLKIYQLKKDIVSKILVEGVDFGKVPGSEKPALLKSGAEKMTNFYALAPEFSDIQTVEDWIGSEHGGEPFFYYRQKCNLYRNLPDGSRIMVASADGSCNSWEKKYRYRQSERVCPNCGQSAIIKGRQEYGGGWLCYAKKGGCGAKYADNDPTIITQDVGQVKNPDVAEQVNTMLKMAQKRALVAATLIATNTSDYFTQDIEDLWHGEIINAEVVKDTPEETKKTESKAVPHPDTKKNKREAEKPSGPVGWLIDWGVANVFEAAQIATKLKFSSSMDKKAAEKMYSNYRALRDEGHEADEAAAMVLS